MNEKPDKSYLEEREEITKVNEDRINRFAHYQKMRATAHGENMPAPIVKDKEGTLRWLNRAQRRKQKIK